MDKYVKLDEIIDALWKNEKAHTPDGYNDSLFDDIKKLPTKTIDEGFKVGDKVYDVTPIYKNCKFSHYEIKECTIKRKHMNRYSVHNPVYGKSERLWLDLPEDAIHKTRQEAEAKLKEVEGE